MSDGTYGCLRVTTGVCDCLCVSVDAYRRLRVPTGV